MSEIVILITNAESMKLARNNPDEWKLFTELCNFLKRPIRTMKKLPFPQLEYDYIHKAGLGDGVCPHETLEILIHKNYLDWSFEDIDGNDHFQVITLFTSNILIVGYQYE